MPGCTAPNCTNSSQKGYKLYHFPSDKERSALWVKNCGREDGWLPTRHTCVCEVHFEESEFESHRADGLRKLKPYAVPTKFNRSNHGPVRRKKQKRNYTQVGVETLISETYHCFICGSNVWKRIPLATCTETSKMPMNQKLVQLVSQEFDLLVEDSAAICTACAQILNCIDYVESVLSILSIGILNLMRKKFGMEPREETDLLSYMKSLRNLHDFCSVEEKDEVSFQKNENMKTSLHMKSTSQQRGVCVKSNELKDGIQELNGATLECKLCSYKTTYKAVLIFHLRQHYQQLYSCDFCNTPVIFESDVQSETHSSNETLTVCDPRNKVIDDTTKERTSPEGDMKSSTKYPVVDIKSDCNNENETSQVPELLKNLDLCRRSTNKCESLEEPVENVNKKSISGQINNKDQTVILNDDAKTAKSEPVLVTLLSRVDMEQITSLQDIDTNESNDICEKHLSTKINCSDTQEINFSLTGRVPLNSTNPDNSELISYTFLENYGDSSAGINSSLAEDCSEMSGKNS